VGFMHVGDIDYHGVMYTIHVGADPKLANQSWELQKKQYFPDYTGPPPAGLPESKRLKEPAITEERPQPKRDLF
jgi:hypothetical protein